MYYMNDEEYFEPSEFDEKIEEFKDELRQSVKRKSRTNLRSCARKTKNCRVSRKILNQ